jgi:hypothetical protein
MPPPQGPPLQYSSTCTTKPNLESRQSTTAVFHERHNPPWRESTVKSLTTSTNKSGPVEVLSSAMILNGQSEPPTGGLSPKLHQYGPSLFHAGSRRQSSASMLIDSDPAQTAPTQEAPFAAINLSNSQESTMSTEDELLASMPPRRTLPFPKASKSSNFKRGTKAPNATRTNEPKQNIVRSPKTLVSSINKLAGRETDVAQVQLPIRPASLRGSSNTSQQKLKRKHSKTRDNLLKSSNGRKRQYEIN